MVMTEYMEVCKTCAILGMCQRKRTLTKDECTWRPRLLPRKYIPQQSISIRRMQREEHMLRLSTIENGGG